MRTPAVLVCGLLLLGLGCGSPCQELADRICNCQPAGSLRDNCKSAVKNQLGSDPQRPTSADEPRCQALLATCPDPDKTPEQCMVLQTPQGKQQCGLAF